jgi:hypothetical protein
VIGERVLKSNRIGIVIPLQGDQLRVTRFDGTGAPAAVNAMRDVADKVRPARGTRDEKL